MASSSKRQRKKQNQAARRAALEAARKRQQQKKLALRIGILVAAVLAGAALITFLGRDDTKEDVSTAGTSTSVTVKPGTQECPKADGSSERLTKFDGPFKPKCTDPAKTYTATLETDVGVIKLQLDGKKAPRTVNNFVSLARYKFYDGVTFHRVIPGFVVQGGDAEGTGSGDPGYTIAEEPPADKAEYVEGALAMAKTPAPNSTSTQFFIVTATPRAEQLDATYSLFGKVAEGMDVVKKIEADGSESGTPKVVHKMLKVTIQEG